MNDLTWFVLQLLLIRFIAAIRVVMAAGHNLEEATDDFRLSEGVCECPDWALQWQRSSVLCQISLMGALKFRIWNHGCWNSALLIPPCPFWSPFFYHPLCSRPKAEVIREPSCRCTSVICSLWRGAQCSPAMQSWVIASAARMAAQPWECVLNTLRHPKKPREKLATPRFFSSVHDYDK